jgi:outer membrane protein assembly factor BamB
MSTEESPIALETPPPAPVPPVQRPVRSWISISPVVAYWLLVLLTDWLELPTFVRFSARLIAGALLAVFAIVWWWANRRTSLRERAVGFAIFVIGGLIAVPLSHPSAGLAGPGILMGSLSLVVTSGMLWVLVARRASPVVRNVGLAFAVGSVWTLLALVRINGLSGDLRPEFHWRWTPSAEQAFLEEYGNDALEGAARSAVRVPKSLHVQSGDWPAFRGPNRDGAVFGVAIRTDWKKHSPDLVWRRRVGPAWSSIVAVEGKLFTQEQREARESVVCYDALTGAEVWVFGDDVRFSEETAGPGPRGTPCFSNGRLYTVGCTGIFNCLDAATGNRLWSHDLREESGAAVPHWGFTGSPLAIGDLVVVFAGGTGSRNLLAYHSDSGELAWEAPAGETSYASPQPATLDGKSQVLMLTNHGLTAVDAGTGGFLWEYAMPLPPSAPRSVQPRALNATSVLVASEADLGTALLDVKHDGKDWSVTQRWASRALKPAFNDSVLTGGFAFGFDGGVFACIDLATGNRRWKDGRYGEGQVLFLVDQSLLVVLSESGEAILLTANPDRNEELGRFRALHGRTWSHPTIVSGKLYVRNAEEMACYDVATRGSR